MPRIALLTRYDTQGASSRVRTLQYLPVLHQAGIETEHFPLFDNDYLQRMYAGKSINLLRARLLAQRIRQMRAIMRSGRFDLLWIEKELLPYLPYAVEKWLLDGRVPYMLDFDDAIFHNYDQSGNPLVRRLLGNKIDRLMAGARLVVCGNGYLAERARSAGAPWVETLPSTIDFEKYRALPAPQQPAISAENPLRIVWIGSPSTAKYLEIVHPVLKKLSEQHPLELRVIGAEARQWPGVQSVHIPWASDTEARELNQSHLGIMPLEDTPWERGKCGFKLIQYMAAGLPVIGSRVGMNIDIVQPGQNGFLAASADEWMDNIQALLASPELRSRMGQVGRVAAESTYSISAVGPKLVQLLQRAASPAGARPA